MRYVNQFCVLVLCVLLGSTVYAGAQDLSEVQKKIQDKVPVEQLEMRSEDNKIVIEGRVPLLKDKVEAAKIAQKAFKKQEVSNNIIVASTDKKDEDITLDVISQIKHDAPQNFSFDTLNVETHGGNVTLTGKVRNAYLYVIAEDAAMKTEGVKAVLNKIDVLPPSLSDDRLRAAVQKKLSNDDRLFYYFMGSTPSITIIVEGSRVTLIGYVDTEADRILAGTLVRQMTGVLSVQNQLVVD